MNTNDTNVEQKDSRPIFTIALGTVIAVVVLFVGWRGLAALSDHGLDVYEATVDRDAMDPKYYEMALLDIEDAIYRSRPTESEDLRRIIDRADGLAEEIRGMRRPAPYGVNPTVELNKFIDDIAPRPGRPLHERTALQERWEKTRATLFQDADWFRWSNAGPDVKEQRVMRRAGEKQLLTDVYNEIESLIESAHSQAMRMPERPSNPQTREAESLNSDWELMATRIKSRLWSTMDRLPSDQQWERPSSMVVSNLDQAVKHVDLLLSYPSLPARTKRTGAFQSARHYLTSARSYLIDLSR